mmetsp:Transcript_78759/g.172719  ORF Transcript_78759/g.172719 Transcript_78759/m.172719 type:complete len:690 (-) Transcript_78759:122-2191(-)
MIKTLLLSAAAVAIGPASGSVAVVTADGDKNRPVTKVITLLKDMQKQLQKEADEDEAIYDKMACWCQTNDREKTEAIKTAEVRIDGLTTKIEELTAGSARLNTEIKNLEKEIAENQDSLDKATAIREKQLAEFNAEEKDLLESVSALKAAITVLSKHHSGGFLQVANNRILGVAATLENELSKHAALLQGVLSPSERRAAAAFVQAPADYFDAAPTFKQSYAPQSGEIFGILRQMLDTFESNLSASQKEEQANQAAYEELKAAKEAEIKAGQDQISTKTGELADTDEKNAQAKVDTDDTKASLSADEQFLGMLKEKCQMTDKEWEERQKTRQLEMEAVSQALAVLSSDDAHDLFTRTFNPSLLQLASSTAYSDRRAAASQVLADAAKKAHNPHLATLAYQVKLDAFTRVKKAIDDMIAQLLKEKDDEIKHKDFCTDEFHQNQLQTEKKDREEQDLTAKIEDLTMAIEQLAHAIEALKGEIAEMQVQLKRAGEDRELENKDFQTMVADQRETQKLLKTALQVLGDFYNKKTASLLQRQEPAGPPPPAGFETYKNNAGSGGVIQLIQQIISDAKAMEAEAIRSEEDAQKAYEDFVKETNASIEAKSKDIVEKSEVKARAEGDLVETKEAKEAVILELEQLSNYNAQLHQSCDFVLKNFELRQTARDEEVEALRQAKAILSGAKFEEFLQKV